MGARMRGRMGVKLKVGMDSDIENGSESANGSDTEIENEHESESCSETETATEIDTGRGNERKLECKL